MVEPQVGIAEGARWQIDITEDLQPVWLIEITDPHRPGRRISVKIAARVAATAEEACEQALAAMGQTRRSAAF